MNRIETTILKNLIHNEDYLRKVIPFLKEEYFTDNSEKVVYNAVSDFVKKYNSNPSLEALEISLQNLSLPESSFKESASLLKKLTNDEKPNDEWLVEETENQRLIELEEDMEKYKIYYCNDIFLI